MHGRSILGPGKLGLCWLAATALAVQDPSPPAADAKVQEALARAIAESPDGTDFAQTPGYRDLVAALLELGPADVAALSPVTLDEARAIADPAALRGTWVKARGYVAGKKPVPLVPPIGEVEKIERAILKLDHEQRAVACDLVGDPPPFKKQADTVEVAGIYFRTVTYEADTGKRPTLPYVMARQMELVDTPSSGMVKSLLKGGPRLWAGSLIGLLGVVLFVFVLRRSARHADPDHQ